MLEEESQIAVQKAVQSATASYALGDLTKALEILDALLLEYPNTFSACLSKAEMLLADKQIDAALICAQKAWDLNPEDLHLHTTLSRIWVAKGDKAKAEHFGGQAKVLSWKKELSATVEK